MGELQQTHTWISEASFVEHLLSWASSCFPGQTVQNDEGKKRISVLTSFFDEESSQSISVEISIRVKEEFMFVAIFCTEASMCCQPDNEGCQGTCRGDQYQLDNKGKLSYCFPAENGRTLVSQCHLKRILDGYRRKFVNDVLILKTRMDQIIKNSDQKLSDKRMPYQLHAAYRLSIQKRLSPGIYSGLFNRYQDVQVFRMHSNRTEILEKIISLGSDNLKVVGWVPGDVDHAEVGSYTYSPSSMNKILVLCRNDSQIASVGFIEWWRDIRRSKIFREFHAVKAVLELAKLLRSFVALDAPFVPISLEHVFIRRENQGFQINLNVMALLQGLDNASDIDITERVANMTETNLITRSFPMDFPDPPRIPGELKRAPLTLLSWFGLIVALIFFVDINESEGDSEYSLDDCLSDPPHHLSNPVAIAMRQIVEDCFKRRSSTIGDQIGLLHGLLITLKENVVELKVSDFNVGPAYRIVTIGNGGFATVYRAHHKGEHKWLALKQLRGTESHHIEAFKHEIMLLCRLRGNEHVVKLYGVMKRGLVVNEDDDNVFEDDDALHHVIMVSEYCSQGNLRDFINACLVKRGEPGFNYVVDELPIMIDILLGVCNGMKVLHDQNVFHRDLKPENVLLEIGRGGRLVAKVGDLGISRTLEHHRQQSESLLTSVGTIVDIRGSLWYLAPEVFLQKKCNLLTDVYSFAILMHDCLVASDFWTKFSFTFNGEGQDPNGVLQWVRYEFVKGVKDNSVHPIFDGDQASCFPSIPEGLRAKLEDIMRKSWSFERKDRLPFSTIYEQIEEVSESLD